MRIRTHLNPLSHTMNFDRQDWNTAFPQFNNLFDVEIGLGYGDFVQTHSERCIVLFEINQKIATTIKNKSDENNLTNALPVWAHGLN